MKFRRIATVKLLRICQARFTSTEPYFGKMASSRFDAPKGEYGVCYLSADLAVSFAETVIRSPMMNSGFVGKYFPLAMTELTSRRVVSFAAGSTLKLVDFTGASLMLAGGDATVTASLSYDLPQRWSLAIFNAFPSADGILYTSKHINNRTAVALFDRASRKLKVDGITLLTDHPALPKILSSLHVALT